MQHSIYYEISNYVGIIGVTLILAAYFSSQIKQISIDSTPYLVSNLLGALLITYSLYFHWNLASFLIELAWFGISVMGLIRVYRKNKRSKCHKENE